KYILKREVSLGEIARFEVAKTVCLLALWSLS
ncbi:unnamed protein product, partial [marine sediment metagenome]